jgi:hypothetical protein
MSEKCLLCDAPARGWVGDTPDSEAHDCPMCAECCEFSWYWLKFFPNRTPSAARVLYRAMPAAERRALRTSQAPLW